MKVEAFIEKYRQSVTPVGEVFDVVCLFDCTELTHNLAKKHFASIAESPELFMLHYIKHAVGIISPDEEPCYKLEISGTKVSFRGRLHILEASLKVMLVFRKFCQEAIDTKKSSEFYSIENACDWALISGPLPLDLSKEAWTYFFPTLCAPILPVMAEAIGLNYSSEIKNIAARSKYNPMEIRNRDASLITLTPNSREHLTYPILPRTFASTATLSEEFLSLFTAKKLTDFSLVSSKDGSAVGVHKVILYLNGGSAVKAMLDGEWKESKSASINLDYSSQTIELFAEFLYRGPEKFLDYVIELVGKTVPTAGAGSVADTQPDPDLAELFTLATMLDVPALADSCTNLLSLLTTEKDLSCLTELAAINGIDLAGDTHLAELIRHYESVKAAAA